MSVTRSPSPHWRAVRSQCSRTHTESRCQRWWDIAQRISATRTAPFMRRSRCGIRAQPMTSRFAQLVDALNRESRQILHHSPRNCVALEPVVAFRLQNSRLTELTKKYFMNVGIVRLGLSGVNKNRPPDIVVAFPFVENGYRLVRCLRFWRGGGWNRVWIHALIPGCRRSRWLGGSPLFLLQLSHRRQPHFHAVYLLLLIVVLLL
jgi:hypothetical protein